MYQPNWRQKNSKRCVCVCVYLLARCKCKGVRGLRRRQAEEVVVRQWNQRERRRGRTTVKIIRVLLSTLWIVRQSGSQSVSQMTAYVSEVKSEEDVWAWDCDRARKRPIRRRERIIRGGVDFLGKLQAMDYLLWFLSSLNVYRRRPFSVQLVRGRSGQAKKTKTEQTAKSTVLAVAAADCATFSLLFRRFSYVIEN